MIRSTGLRLIQGTILVSVFAISTVAGAMGSAVGTSAEMVVVHKTERTLSLVREGRVVKTYRIALGANPVGAKASSGDGRTPEGRYVIDRRNSNSRFHRSLHISYPGPDDQRRARARGVAPGGDIMVHGLPHGAEWIGPVHSRWDWTRGCIAVTNAEMDEIWDAVPDGTPIVIEP
ncbi:MAG: L,D-transpeptidase family protein [Alphaproteobacteria bacterium]